MAQFARILVTALAPVKIVLSYALFGLAWVFFSDRLAATMFRDAPDILLQVSTYKGFVFVLGSALLLYLLMTWQTRTLRKQERALRESEERYRLVVESAPEAILIHDGAQYVFANEAARRLFGAPTAAALVGVAANDLVAAESATAYQECLDRIAAKRVPVRLGQQQWQCLDGTPVTVDGTIAPYSQNGSVATLVMLRDIGQQQAVEQSLRESEAKYRLLADNAYDLIFTLDPDLRQTYVSPSVKKLRGIPADQAVQESLQEIMTPASYALVREAAAKHLASGTVSATQVERMELELRRRDGSTVWVESVVRPMFEENGTFRGVVGVARDISERRQAEEERNRFQIFLSKILDAIPDPVFVKGTDRRLVLVNDALCVFMGNSRQELVGRLDTELLTLETAEAIRIRDDHVFSTGEENIAEEHLMDTLGREHVMMTKKALFSDAQGQRFIVGVIRDITDAKTKEAMLRDSLQEKEVLLKEVHHRVKNNLQIISSLLFLQEEGIADPAIQELFEESRHRISSMALVHEELYRSGDLGRVDLREYLERLAPKVVQSLRGEKALELVLELASCLLPLDKAIPFGLLVNELLTNAVKHGFVNRGSGTIRVTTEVEGDFIRAIITDDGVGLPEGFHPEATKSLGMQLVIQLTRQLRGALTFGSDRGTVFRLSFPLADLAG